MGEKEIGIRQLRSFGLIVGGGFVVVALAPVVFHGRSPRIWALTTALSLSAAALIAPQVLRPFYRIWMAIGEVMGWLNTRIILTVLYYIVIVPIGVILRVAGKDPMRRTLELGAPTYRILRDKRAATHMQRQY